MCAAGVQNVLFLNINGDKFAIYVPIRRYGDLYTLRCSRRVYLLLKGVIISISMDRNVDNKFIPGYRQK